MTGGVNEGRRREQIGSALTRPLSDAEAVRLAEWRRRVGRAAARLYAVLADLDEVAGRLATEVPQGADAPRHRRLDNAEDAAALRRGDAIGRAAVPTDPFAALAALLPVRRLRVLVLRLARLAARPGRVESRRVSRALADAAPEALEVLAGRVAAWRADEPGAPPGDGAAGVAAGRPSCQRSTADDADLGEGSSLGDTLAANLAGLLEVSSPAGRGGPHMLIPVTSSGAGRGAAAALWRDVAARHFSADPEEVLEAAMDDDLPYLDPRNAAEAGLAVLPLCGRWLAAWRDGCVDAEDRENARPCWQLCLVRRREDGSLRLDELR
jgi:hypothetical protein